MESKSNFRILSKEIISKPSSLISNISSPSTSLIPRSLQKSAKRLTISSLESGNGKQQMKSKLAQVQRALRFCRDYNIVKYYQFMDIPPEEYRELRTHCSKDVLETAADINYQEYYYEEVNNRLQVFLSYGDGSWGEEEEEIVMLFKHNNVDISKFCEALYSIFTMSDYRKNCIFLNGNIKTGKTLMMRLITGNFKCVGKGCNNGVNSEFYYQKFIGRSICVLEEPFLDPQTLEDFKSIFGGEGFDISCKFHNPQTLNRTPFIITSNFSLLSRGHAPSISEMAIKDRFYIFNFNNSYTPKCKLSPKNFVNVYNKYYG
uniref:Nonstructural protein n=2 Tax=Viruses TaxID=10239 RepID=A0A8E8H147_NPVBM|nr:nonstructural protein [Bombyx mori bidensovirus]QWC64892.1 nonstructural protein [Bombyx mori nucleopolyhedrovirus]